MATQNARTRLLIGTTANWAASDLTIGDGELVLERAASGVKIKAGDGLKKFSQLPYLQVEPVIPAEYLTESEGDARYLKLTDTGPFLTEAEAAGQYLKLSDIVTAPTPNKVPRLDANGLIPNNMISLSLGRYKGLANVTAAVPAGSYIAGDYFINTTAGAAHASWGMPGGTNLAANDQMIYNGATWDKVAQSSAYLPLTGGTLAGPGNLSVSGTLGVGTAAPGAKVHIVNTPPAASPAWNAVDTLAISATTNNVLQLHVGATGGSMAYAFAVAGARSVASMSYDTTTNGLIFNNGAERARINSAGQFLIGNNNAPSSASNRLLVYAPASDAYIELASNVSGGANIGGTNGGGFVVYTFTGAVGSEVSTERLRVTSAGFVGMGTATPDAPLQVLGATNIAAGARSLKAHIGGASSWGGVDASEELGIGFSGIRSIFTGGDNWDLAFTAGTSTTFGAGTQPIRMRITAGGDVGIGTTAPAARLHLTTPGAANTALRLENGAGSAFFVMRSDGGSEISAPDFFRIQTANVERARIDAAGVFTYGGVELGYKDVPLRVVNGASAIAATDRGRGIRVDTAGAVTVPVLQQGSVVTVHNNSGGSISLTPSGVNMRLAGTASTGARTLAANGLASLYWSDTTLVMVSGSGVS